MSEIQVAESNTPKKKTTKKTLDRLELHPKLGGGHIVKHVYSGYEHDPLEVEFNKAGKAKGGEHIVSHLSKHGGLPGLEGYDKHGESETEDEIED
jgi:hypothetical protein